MRTSFVSSQSPSGSKVSLSHPASSSFQSKSQTRQALNDIYNRLDKLSHKFDSVALKNGKDKNSQDEDGEEDEDVVGELEDIVFKTQFLTKKNKTSGLVFHSQDVSAAVPMRFKKKENSQAGTFVNRLDGLKSTVVERVQPKRMQHSKCMSLGAE